MVILITGASHSGKTALAQRLLEKIKFPYLSQDHLKMGLIRSGQTSLTPMDDALLTDYLWPITREIAKTAIENQQNLIIEGCYMPLSWENDFAKEYLSEIRFVCLVMTENYIRRHFDAIKEYAGLIERRLDDSDCTVESVLEDNRNFGEACRCYGIKPVEIDEDYWIDVDAIIEGRDC